MKTRGMQRKRRNYNLRDRCYYKGLHCQRNILSLAHPPPIPQKRGLQYLWAKYESLSQQYYAANLNYAVTYKTTINFTKAKYYSEQRQLILSKYVITYESRFL